ncbi:MAG TPA: YhdP family protein, partial [Terriglobia bacterium]|nr:YhdP family protein [Terriglobia bacterium]
YTSHYLPLVLNPEALKWLDSAILGGRSENAAVRIKGDLAEFPFVDEKRGLFQVTARITGGILEYATGWPRIENISAELGFRGRRMEIKADSANIFGAKLSKVRVAIPDLLNRDERLEIGGEATGPLADKIRFINESPVSGMIDGFTEGIRATGSGKLLLKLAIPVRHARDTRVAGDYQFIDAGIEAAPGRPAISEVNGRLQFTESSIKAQGITGQVLGGPATLNVTSAPEGGVQFDAQGRSNVAALATLVEHPLLRRLQGTTEWRATALLRKGSPDYRIGSNLVGVSADLPEPFAKMAQQEWPLLIERKVTGSGQDLLSVALNDAVFGLFERTEAEGGTRLRRGVLSFGKQPALPQRDGIQITGSLGTLDLDRWRPLLKGQGDEGLLAGVDLTVDRLVVFGKPIHALHVNARAQDGNWSGSLAGREVAGEFNWKPAGRGLIHGRLKHFILPEDLEPQQGRTPAAVEGDYPALDIVADSFQVRQRKFGKLELKAVQQDRDWRIEKLRLAREEGVLDAEGVWQGAAGRPRTALNVNLQVSDVGGFLAALGYPDTVRRGTASVSGKLDWPGNPYDMSPANLSGNFKLEAKSGQFLKAEPGAGKLLGLISLQALPRRITLDFRDVFSDGFAFDVIEGNMKISQGVMKTDDFFIKGPAALVQMSGEVNLANETQNLRVRVIPTLGEGVSIASALIGGPVAGLTTLIVQKLLQNPLEKIAAYEYSVTGTWDNPNVAKLVRAPVAAE